MVLNETQKKKVLYKKFHRLLVNAVTKQHNNKKSPVLILGMDQVEELVELMKMACDINNKLEEFKTLHDKKQTDIKREYDFDYYGNT